MTPATGTASGERRLEQLYEIGKLLAALDVTEHTLDEALQVIARKLPLASAILIESAAGGHTEMTVWPCEDSDPHRLQAAKTHAAEAYTYLVDGQPRGTAELREDLGPTMLPSPDLGERPPGDANRFLVLPLVVGHDAVFGALQLEGAARLDRGDLEFANAIANQLAIAIDRKRTQDQLRDQRSLTSALAASLAEGTLAIDLDGRITFINEAGAGLLGYSVPDTLGKPSAEIIHVETTEGTAVDSPLAAAIQTGRVQRDAHLIERADHVRFPASYKVTPIRRGDRVTGAVLAFDDISEHKRGLAAEHFLLEASVVLSASLESAAVISASARLGVPRLGELCFVDIVSADDQLAHAAWAHVDPAEQHDLDRAFSAASRAPLFTKPAGEVIALGRSMQLPSLDDSWFAAADVPIIKQLGIRSALIVPLTLGARRLGSLTFCTTGERQHREGDLALGEELARRSALAIEHARLYEQARLAIALREQTLAIVSHDLRSPLATIVMAASILGDDEMIRANPRATTIAVDKIQTAAVRMERMIGDLLDFASIEAGHLSILPEPHKVPGIIEEAMASFEAMAHKRQITLTGDLPPDMPAIQCDRDRILQVLSNLVANAVKSVPSGGLVILRATVEGREAVFSVSDTGPGIATADQKRLFERYWRCPGANYKGTGLGLAIARGLVEAHRGRLWVDSEIGRGATFYFTVPLAESSRGSPERADQPRHPHP